MQLQVAAKAIMMKMVHVMLLLRIMDVMTFVMIGAMPVYGSFVIAMTNANHQPHAIVIDVAELIM